MSDYDFNLDDVEGDFYLAGSMKTMGSGTHTGDFYSKDTMVTDAITPDLQSQIMDMLGGTMGETWEEICQYLVNSEALRKSLWWSTYSDTSGWAKTTRRIRYRQRSTTQMRNERWNRQYKALHDEYFKSLLTSVDENRAADLIESMTNQKMRKLDLAAFRSLSVSFMAAVSGTSKEYVRRMDNKDGRAVAFFNKALERPEEGEEAAMEVHQRAAGLFKTEIIDKGYLRQPD